MSKRIKILLLIFVFLKEIWLVITLKITETIMLCLKKALLLKTANFEKM